MYRGEKVDKIGICQIRAYLQPRPPPFESLESVSVRLCASCASASRVDGHLACKALAVHVDDTVGDGGEVLPQETSTIRHYYPLLCC